MKRWLQVGMGWVILLGACAPGPRPPPTLPPTPPPLPIPSLWEGVTSIGRLREDPGAYVGREVWILAYFRGWDVLGEVGSPPPVTRSDVVFADVRGAIYADARTLERVPGVEELHRQSAMEGHLFRLRARVRQAADGSPYLELLEGEEVQGLPVGVLLREYRSGGIMGAMEELLVLEGGKAIFISWNVRRRCVIEVESGEVAGLLKGLRALPDVIGQPIPDGYTHEITFRDGASFRRVTIYTPSGSDEARPVLDILGRWGKPGGDC